MPNLPALNEAGLRDCQIIAIKNLETSLKADKPRALVPMATGSGKTFTAISEVYRLLKFVGAKRILFLVDTRNLGEQAEQEFMSFVPNDDNRKPRSPRPVRRTRRRPARAPASRRRRRSQDPPKAARMSTAPIVQKVWNFCTTLRDDGVGYGDYLEQITYLIFLKMADEYSRPPNSRNVGVPPAYAWPKLRALTGAALEVHYVETLRALGTQSGMLGQIFTKAQNKVQDPAKLARLVGLIDEENWAMLGADVKGDIYEGLLERNAEDTKSGAGQ